MKGIGKRILAGLTLVVGTVMLLLSLVGGVGVWIIKGPVTARATRLFERIEAALNVADQGLDQVESSLARASERLDSAREEQRLLALEPQQNLAMRRILARTVQQRVSPEINEANHKLHTVAEAAVVVNSVLEDVANIPLFSVAGLDVDRLTEINNRLADVGPAAWELSRLLGEPGSAADGDAAAAQLSKIERALEGLRRLIAEYEPQFRQVRQRTEALKSQILYWITPAAVLLSFVCFWIALSQISLLVHAWSWWKQAVVDG